MKNKKLLSLLLVMALAISMLAACSTQKTPTPTATPTATATAAPEETPTATPEPAKTELTIGFTSIPSSFDPLQGTSTTPLLFSTLVQTDTDMNVRPHNQGDKPQYVYRPYCVGCRVDNRARSRNCCGNRQKLVRSFPQLVD